MKVLAGRSILIVAVPLLTDPSGVNSRSLALSVTVPIAIAPDRADLKGRERTAGRMARVRPLSHATSPEARCIRVGSLLLATLIMSIGDLYMTLTLAKSVGMLEANPLSRAVMAQDSPALVILWRMGTVLLGLGILYYFRRLARAEIGAWICFIAMLTLTTYWTQYIEAINSLGPVYGSLAMTSDPQWIQMD